MIGTIGSGAHMLVQTWSVGLMALAVFIPVAVGMLFLREKLWWRVGLLIAFVTAVVSLDTWWLAVKQPEIASALAVKQFTASNEVARVVRAFHAATQALQEMVLLVVLLSTLLCFSDYARKAFLKWRSATNKTTAACAAGLLVLSVSGCKPFDRPEYVEIDTSETGFVIPLEGDSGQQAKFQSEDYLKQRKVAAKRVQILHRWSQEGRMEITGKWIPSVRLIKVNRSPVTREWTTEQSPQLGGQARRSDRAIWIESGDSVGFSMGFTCTAFISEDDAAKFLYWYPSGSLASVMDSEVRGRIQQAAAEVAAQYPLDILRTKKQEIANAVKNDVTNFFAKRGVAITTVGMFGGMTYENPEIQRSIDQTFIAQQLKVVAEAKFEAQKKENERIELEANAVAEKARREAMGLADARKTAASGEAESIRKINQALMEVQQSPVLYQLKALEVEKARIEKWDGKYPTYFMGTAGSSPSLMLHMPTMQSAESTK
ncbi:MAG: SPFH domain-containing protein [Limisphaerales bacterium]